MNTHMRFPDVLLLLEKAATLLSVRLEKEPQNLVLLEKLGDVCRQLGKLGKAGELFDRLSELDPSSVKAAHLAAIMNQRQYLSELPKEGIEPSPFFIKENFLPQILHDDLLSFALENEDKFTPSPCLSKEMGWVVRPEIRNSSQTPLSVDLMDRIWTFVRPLLPDICALLRIRDIPDKKGSWYLQSYGGGGFGHRHTDDLGGVNRISMVYYLCFPQKTFTGGSFLLYDRDASDGGACPDGNTQLPFVDNLLVAFPSERSHAITLVNCPQTGIRYGRLAIPIHLG